MKKTYNALFWLCLLCPTVIFQACVQKRQTDKLTVTYDSINIEKKISLLQEIDSTQPYSDVKIHFTFPTACNTSNDDLMRLQQIFIGTFFNDEKYDDLSPQQAIEAYLKDYTESYKSLSDSYHNDKKNLQNAQNPPWYWYRLNLNNRIQFENSSLISYVVNFSENKGGTQNAERFLYYNIDLNTLDEIYEEDLFIPNYKKKLSDLLIQKLMEQHGALTPEDLLEQGFLDVDELMPNNNFLLDDKGVHYIFNQYEIEPYAMDAVDVSIPYADLLDILKPDAIVHQFIDKS